jgi:hypothetical protein
MPAGARCPARLAATREGVRLDRGPILARRAAEIGPVSHVWLDGEVLARPLPADQIPLTPNEIAALFATLIIKPVPDARHRLRWSAWRRRHQHRARTCHYRRQARNP